MDTLIIPVQHVALQRYIQYFIFFRHTGAQSFVYKTFPNTNLCLAIYKENHVNYQCSANENICHIGHSNSFTSRLFGFHEQPFHVNINAPLDQVCILFNPGGLRAFTEISYHELVKENEVFERIFNTGNASPDSIFETDDANKRASLLEEILLQHLTITDVRNAVDFSIKHINAKNGNTSVNELSGLLNISESTLYRNFNSSIGQSPKDFIQTVRFRNALSLLLKKQYQNLTGLTYQSQFYDQSHFIKDFKKRTGLLPNMLYKNIRLEQDVLAWSTGKI